MRGEVYQIMWNSQTSAGFQTCDGIRDGTGCPPARERQTIAGAVRAETSRLLTARAMAITIRPVGQLLREVIKMPVFPILAPGKLIPRPAIADSWSSWLRSQVAKAADCKSVIVGSTPTGAFTEQNPLIFKGFCFFICLRTAVKPQCRTS